MGKYTLADVKKSMGRKRLAFLKEATKSKEVKFGNDPEVLDFVIRYYWDQYVAWHGNGPYLSEVSYEDYYDMLAGRDYSDLMEVLKDDWDNAREPETKWLIDMARKLRKRYGRK